MIVISTVSAIAALLGGVYFYMHWTTYRPRVETLDIAVFGERAEQNLHVLHLTDLHMEKISVTPEKLRVILANQPIDLIALTGDFLENPRHIPKLRRYLDILAEKEPTIGLYAVLGNHDYILPREGLGELQSLFQEMGVKLLRNEHTSVSWQGELLHIVGIDDAYTRHDDLTAAFTGLPSEGKRLVLSHDPTVVLKAHSYSYDYLLSGHFHGGQILWPKPYHLSKMSPLPKLNMVKGLHYYGDKPFYISEGLGQTGINARFRSRPEITFHRLG